MCYNNFKRDHRFVRGNKIIWGESVWKGIDAVFTYAVLKIKIKFKILQTIKQTSYPEFQGEMVL